MHKLTDKQEIFCCEYLIDLNGKQAALRAGYSTQSAVVSGSRNLKNPAIAAKIEELMDERKARVGASADYVLQRLVEIDKLDVGDILDNQGNVMPIKQWSQAWRRSVAAIDISEVKTANALVKKIRMPDKLKNLEMIGKHVNVSAFRERMDVAGGDSRELVVNVSTPEAKANIEQLAVDS